MIVAAPGNRQTAQVGIADITQLGDGTQTTGWFSDNGANVGGYMVDLDQPDVARTLDRLATVRGMAAERLALYILESDGTTRLACELTTPVGWYSRPSWSPDGRTLTYSDNQGLWTIAVPDDWATTCNLHPTLLAPGASDAGWSNADLSAPSTSGGSETPGQPGSSGTTSGGQVSGSVQGPPQADYRPSFSQFALCHADAVCSSPRKQQTRLGSPSISPDAMPTNATQSRRFAARLP